MGTMILKVLSLRDEADGIRAFELADPAGGELPAFTAGDHIDVHTGTGLVRQYSLCNGPLDRRAYVIAVKREPMSRGGSHWMHDHLRQGDLVTIGGPRNSFPLEGDAESALLIGAGIGLTPVLSMARTLAHTGRTYTLHCFSRSAAHTPFREELSAADKGGQIFLHEGLEIDRQKSLLRDILAEPGKRALYMCGPMPFMEQVEQIAALAGWPTGSIRSENFGAAETAKCGDRHIEVVLASSGRTIIVPADSSIARTLIEAGVNIEVSCEQGLCGSCLTRVLEGTPEHRDTFLTEAEKADGTLILPCVSRARTESLVLDR
ncbi:oxidoreductase [Mesorhizobium waimense]|uniref:Oxidoreductase n=1 Tax=Mesorhizobium waimense TaxID=1300307 RepID=A0A3A5KXG4_9HYPH|nr:PDR/VanB family oxidoreductase [Mesorhizobium waimense]RJT41447.1 oxidoreductase [Mesorhizobium waimense]